MFGFVAAHAEHASQRARVRPEWTAAVDRAVEAFEHSDADELDLLLARGLERIAWDRREHAEAPVWSYLRGGTLTVYEALRERGHRPSGKGPMVCEGDGRSPGCQVVFLAGRDARWCPTCQKRPIAYKPWGAVSARWADPWEPCRTVVYGRMCEQCGEGFTTTDSRQEHCSPRCRQRAYRSRAA